MHPSKDELRRYLNDELDEVGRAAIEAHLQDCPLCPDVLDTLEAPGQEGARDLAAALGRLPLIPRRSRPPAPDHDPAHQAGLNLLFSVLALQNDFITRDDLLEAFAAWVADKARPLAQLLVERGALDQARRALLEHLVAEHLKQHGGDPEVSLASVSSLGSVREDLEWLDDADLRASLVAAGPRPAGSSGDAASTATYTPPSHRAGGRFRILWSHKQGGLGRVYIACDEELGREVALKQIRPERADDPESRARFLREAEVTGRLEHPGVVPVYSLGTGDGGRPFYAMQFVRGESLKEAIDRFHRSDALPDRDPAERTLALRQLLRRFIDVCNAIAYAHSRGVIHRDLKPANILLGKYGETLVVDWGLAKVIGRYDPTPLPTAEVTLRPAWHSGSVETMAGSAIGTPSYMSPEQAEGRPERIGPASDIYGLGATLYCLATGRPPLEGGDTEDLLLRVRQGDIPPPRQVNPRVPAALEAIVVKAMAVRLGDRYQSAYALAEEIEHWLADEPVSAWRESLAQRGLRWVRRRRTAVTAAAATGLVAFLGLVAVVILQAQKTRELSAANMREREKFALAFEAIEMFHKGISEDLLLKQKEFEELRGKLLRGARDFYKRLEVLSEKQTDRESRSALTRAYYDLGELTSEVGSQEEALASHRQALTLRMSLASEAGAGNGAKADVGQSLLAIGWIYLDTGQTAEALRHFEEARRYFESITRSDPTVAPYKVELAMSYRGLHFALEAIGRQTEAFEAGKRVREIRQALVDANPDVPQYQSDLAGSIHNIGRALSITGKTAEALEAFEEARAIQEEAVKANPSSIQFQEFLANHHESIGYQLSMAGKQAEALPAYTRALAIREARAKAYPAISSFQVYVAQNLNEIGWVLYLSGKPAEAIKSCKQGRALVEPMAEANPAIIWFQRQLAQSHYDTGYFLSQIGEFPEAKKAYEEAEKIFEQLAADNHDDPESQDDAADIAVDFGTLKARTGDPAEGLRLGCRALERLKRIPVPVAANFYTTARAHALIGYSLEKARLGTTTEGADASSDHLETAMSLLRHALSSGFRHLPYLHADWALDPLRSRPDFQLLILELEFPADPFAR